VIVEAIQFDGAGGGIAVDHQLHDGGRLLEIGIALVFGLREYSARSDDIRIDVRIDGARLGYLLSRYADLV